MRPVVWLALLALSTVAYAATIATDDEFNPSLTNKANNVMVKAGKKLEALGRVLQGRISESSAEATRDVAEALEALAAAEDTEDKESDEYWVGVIVRGIAGGAVAHGIDRWRNRKG